MAPKRTIWRALMFTGSIALAGTLQAAESRAEHRCWENPDTHERTWVESNEELERANAEGFIDGLPDEVTKAECQASTPPAPNPRPEGNGEAPDPPCEGIACLNGRTAVNQFESKPAGPPIYCTELIFPDLPHVTEGTISVRNLGKRAGRARSYLYEPTNGAPKVTIVDHPMIVSPAKAFTPALPQGGMGGWLRVVTEFPADGVQDRFRNGSWGGSLYARTVHRKGPVASCWEE